MRVAAWFLLGVAAFLAVAALIYAASSGDETGRVLLLLSAGLGVMIGGYLLTLPGEQPAAAAGEAGAAPAVEEAYLPAASVWPFWTGLGATVVANGLALGLWGLVPGGVVTVVGIFGFARQSRRRD